jgi:hypothetical protein
VYFIEPPAIARPGVLRIILKECIDQSRNAAGRLVAPSWFCSARVATRTYLVEIDDIKSHAERSITAHDKFDISSIVTSALKREVEVRMDELKGLL